MTKEEIKEMILGITKENTTERLHAEILNAIVDAMGVDSLSVPTLEDDKVNVAMSFKDAKPFIDAPIIKYHEEYLLKINYIEDEFYNYLTSLGTSGYNYTDITFGKVRLIEGDIDAANGVAIYNKVDDYIIKTFDL